MNSILNELKVTVVSKLRYPFEFIVELVMITVLYGIILAGTKLIGGAGFNLGIFKGEAAIGFVVWMVCSEIIDQFPGRMVNYARIGVLEQIFVSSVSGEAIVVMDQMASVLWHAVKAGIVFTVLVLITQTHLFFSAMAVPVAILTVVGVMGVGFILIGMGVLFNRIKSFTAIISYLFLGLAMMPVSSGIPKIVQFVPFVLGMDMLKKLLLTKSTIGAVEFTILLVNSLFYLFAGFFVMRFCINAAKKSGLMGQY